MKITRTIALSIFDQAKLFCRLHKASLGTLGKFNVDVTRLQKINFTFIFRSYTQHYNKYIDTRKNKKW
ncbi:MAG: hypothetical protein QY310_03200 [Candidatus Jettenia sp. CY-1]|nr:MAG: hypothetical protein QY310_03200 [Candidatus Jettenia sp. CY-1]